MRYYVALSRARDAPAHARDVMLRRAVAPARHYAARAALCCRRQYAMMPLSMSIRFSDVYASRLSLRDAASLRFAAVAGAARLRHCLIARAMICAQRMAQMLVFFFTPLLLRARALPALLFCYVAATMSIVDADAYYMMAFATPGCLRPAPCFCQPLFTLTVAFMLVAAPYALIRRAERAYMLRASCLLTRSVVARARYMWRGDTLAGARVRLSRVF